MPLLADASSSLRQCPLNVHALPETIAALKKHMLNGELWPDYSILPSVENPYVRFVRLGERRITSLPARHSVPAVGYCVNSGAASFVYSGDTTDCEEFWEALNRIENLRYLMIETTFLNDAGQAAARSGRLTVELLARPVAAATSRAIVHRAHGVRHGRAYHGRNRRRLRCVPSGAIAAGAAV